MNRLLRRRLPIEDYFSRGAAFREKARMKTDLFSGTERKKERETRNWVLEKRDDENLFRDFGKDVGSSLFHSPPKFLGARSEKAITGRVSRRRQQQPVQVEAEHTDPIHKMKKKKTIPLTHTHVHSETAKAEAMFVLFARSLAL